MRVFDDNPGVANETTLLATQKQAFSEQVWVQLWLLFAVAERNHAVPGYKRLLCKTHTTVCAAQKLTQCSWKWFRSLIWIFYKIRHLIWLAGVVRDHSHEALLIMLFIYFLNFIALPRVQAWSGRVHAKDQPLRTNWIGNVQSVRKRWCVRQRESCPKLWFDYFSQKTLSSQRYQCHCMHGFTFRAKLSLGWGRFYQRMEQNLLFLGLYRADRSIWLKCGFRFA